MCSRTEIFSIRFQERCEYVTKWCNEDINFINLNKFYFCVIDQRWYLMIFLFFFFLILCFRLIQSLSNKYLSVALANISKKIGLSEALTGVTLLAYANGAPDIVSSAVAGFQKDGVLLSVGGLFGAAIFTCNVAFAFILDSSPEREKTELPKSLFLRDVMFFFASTVTVLVIGFLRLSLLAVSIILFSIYFIYVAVVGIGEYLTRNAPKIPLLVRSFRSAESFDNQDAVVPTSKFQATKPIRKTSKDSKPPATELSLDPEPETPVFDEPPPEDEKSPRRHINARGLFKFYIRQKLMFHKDCMQSNSLDLFFFPVQYPLQLLFDITVPPAEENDYHAAQAVTFPFLTVYACIFLTRNSFTSTIAFLGHEVPLLLLILPFQLLLSLLIWSKTKDGNPRLPMLLMITSALTAMAWILFITKVVMDMLNFVQAISGLSNIFLGITLLSLGNSLNDLFVNSELAKQGYTTMAFTGLFSGQMMNLLLGFGLNCLSSYIQARNNNQSVEFELFHGKQIITNKTQFLCFFVLLFSAARLFSHFLIGIIEEWSIPKSHVKGSLFLYLIFILVFIILEVSPFSS